VRLKPGKSYHTQDSFKTFVLTVLRTRRLNDMPTIDVRWWLEKRGAKMSIYPRGYEESGGQISNSWGDAGEVVNEINSVPHAMVSTIFETPFKSFEFVEDSGKYHR
jgi:hypothetical protein